MPPLAFTRVAVAARIEGWSCDVEVEQEYVNNTAGPVEGFVTFQMPATAAVYGVTVVTTNKVIQAQIMEKTTAANKYDDSIASGHSAFLIEQLGPSFFRASCGNVLPTEKVLLKIHYTQELPVDPQEHNSIEFCLPTQITPSHLGFPSPTCSVSISISMASEISHISSPSHPMCTSTLSGSKATVSLNLAESLKSDFRLLISYAGIHEPNVWVEFADQSPSKTAMITFNPLFDTASALLNTEFIFLVDCSGSMSGSRIATTRSTLSSCLGLLPSNVFFNIVRFGSTYESFYPSPVIASTTQISEATPRVWAMEADLGGTEILQPLESIFSQPLKPGASRQIMVFTDGEISNSQEVLMAVHNRAGTIRIFSFGIGPASKELAENLAKSGNGTHVMVLGDSSLREEATSQMSNALQPALVNLSLKFDTGITPIVCIPSTLPPVFSGGNLVAYASFPASNSSRGSVTLCGTDSTGKEQSWTVALDLAQITSTGNQISKLSARRYIRDLEMGFISGISGAEAQSLIISLGIKHSLLSKYTSFVAVQKRETAVSESMTSSEIPSAATSITETTTASGIPAVVPPSALWAKPAGEMRYTDTRQDEQLRGITINPRVVPLLHQERGEITCVNFHREFFLENVWTVIDGCLLVTTVQDGFGPTEHMLIAKAIKHKVKPLLCVNKLDVLLSDTTCTISELSNRIYAHVQEFNSVVAYHLKGDSTMGDLNARPDRGNVLFSCGLQNWGFTLPTFARVYAQKLGIEEDKLVEKLWGNWCWDVPHSRWLKKGEEGTSVTGFEKYVLEPLVKIYTTATEEDLRRFGKTLNLELERDSTLRPLRKQLLGNFLFLQRSLLSMVKANIPSPVEAQKYRAKEFLQSSNARLEAAIHNCSASGPLVIYLQSVYPFPSKNTTMCRILSGTMHDSIPMFYRQSEKPRIIRRIIAMNGTRCETLTVAGCGAFVGVNWSSGDVEKPMILASDKLLCDEIKQPFTPCPTLLFQALSHEPEDMRPLLFPSLMEPGPNESLFDMERPVIFTQIRLTRSATVSGKSPNRHNDFTFTASPLSPEFLSFISCHKGSDIKSLNEKCRELNVSELRILCVFEDNVLAVEPSLNVREIASCLEASFPILCTSEQLCGSRITGLLLTLTHCTFHSDSIHRGMGQVHGALRPLFSSLESAAEPQFIVPMMDVVVIVEPSRLYLVEEKLGPIGQVMQTDPYGSILRLQLHATTASVWQLMHNRKERFALYYYTDKVNWEPVPGSMLVDTPSPARQLYLSTCQLRGMKPLP
ncbi:von willebrand factor a [Pelomyxa schiedti]|nr:von willebrand factor a [Pelomyxa schiedti]